MVLDAEVDWGDTVQSDASWHISKGIKSLSLPFVHVHVAALQTVPTYHYRPQEALRRHIDMLCGVLGHGWVRRPHCGLGRRSTDVQHPIERRRPLTGLGVMLVVGAALEHPSSNRLKTEVEAAS